jgi:hypothetical protein
MAIQSQNSVTYTLHPEKFQAEIQKQHTMNTTESLKRATQLSLEWAHAEAYYAKAGITDRTITVVTPHDLGASLELGTHPIYQQKPQFDVKMETRPGFFDPVDGGTAVCAAADEFGGGALRSGWNNEEMKLHECTKAIHLLIQGTELFARKSINKSSDAKKVGEGYATPFMLKDLERFIKYSPEFFGNQKFADNSIDMIIKTATFLEKPVKFDFIFIALSNLGNSAPEDCVKAKAYKDLKWNKITKTKEPTTELSQKLKSWQDDKVNGLPVLQCSVEVLREEFAALYKLAQVKITKENPYPEIPSIRVGTQAFCHSVQAIFDMHCLVSAITGVKFIFPDTKDEESKKLFASAEQRIANYKNFTIIENIAITAKALHAEMLVETLIRHRE